MDKKLALILEELYALDPKLKKQASVLPTLLKDLLEQRPEATIDPVFCEELRATLLRRLAARPDESPSFFRSLFAPRSAYAFSALALVLLTVVAAHTLVPSAGFKLIAAQPQAYGPLRFPYLVGENGGLGGGGVFASDARVNYEYHYKGEALPDLSHVEVLHRVRVPEPYSFHFQTEAMDLDGLEDLSFEYEIALSPVDGQGYSIHYDVQRQTVIATFYQGSTPDCPWGVCPNVDTSDVKAADRPSEAHIIAIADTFLKNLKIRQDLLATPRLDRQQLERMDSDPYIVPVIYPYRIEGKAVYTPAEALIGAIESGLDVSVNLHEDRVESLSSVYLSETFEKSSYAAATSDEILDVVGAGGLTGAPHWEDPTATVSFDLGTPKVVYMQTQVQTDFESKELYVPAYLFPVLNDKDQLFEGEGLLIPLAEDLLKNSTAGQ